VSSDITVLREVGGAAAVYCPVGDVDAWRNAVINLLEERARRDGAWERRRSDGLAHSARFSWAESARQTARVYRQVLAGLE